MSLCKEKTGITSNVRGYFLLVKTVELPEKSGTIILHAPRKHEAMRKRLPIGQVLAVGPDCFNKESVASRRCDVGDWIIYSLGERVQIAPGGEDCYYISDDKIIDIISEEDKDNLIKGALEAAGKEAALANYLT